MIKLCKQHKIKSISLENLKIEFSEDTREYQQTNTQQQINLINSKDKVPTEDELLFWSSPEQIDVEAKPPTI